MNKQIELPKNAIVIDKKISEIKFKETPELFYVYQDNIKKQYEFMYNDELKLPLNVMKIVQKELPGKVSIKKVFDSLEDIYFLYGDEHKEKGIFEIVVIPK